MAQVSRAGLASGTGADLTIAGGKVGIRPSYVNVVNRTQGKRLEWFEGMDDGAAVAVDSEGAMTQLTADGITPVQTGFVLAAAFHADGDELAYFVMG